MAAGTFDAQVRAFVADLRGPAMARVVADAHRDLHARVLQDQRSRAGVAPGFRHVVDGKVGAGFESVKPGGRIVTVYDYRREIALFALAALRSSSPASSGRYRGAHFFMINGREARELPETIEDGATITISNSAPYARRLEVGKKKDGSAFVVQVPPRIYERVAKQVVGPRYRKVAKIAFTYVDLAGAYRLKGNQKKRRRTAKGWQVQQSQSADRRAGQPIRYPAIVITPLF